MEKIIFDILVHFGPAFLIGILHTLIPCEDKAIFFFWSFGISKTAKKSFLILLLYGLGLLCANVIISLISSLISLTPIVLFPGFTYDPYVIGFVGSLTSLIAVIFLYFFITYTEYGLKIHSRYKDEITKLNWDRSRTPYLFGLLVGFAPCFYEFLIYSNSIILTTTGGILSGIAYVIFFSLGTFIGLIIIALAKQGTSQVFKHTDRGRSNITIAIIIIIIIFNVIMIITNLFRFNIYPTL